MRENKKKRVLGGIFACVLSLGILFANGTNVLAADDAQASITKNLLYAEGITTPDASFTFTFTKVDVDGYSANEDLQSMPVIADQTINYSSLEQKDAEDGLVTFTKETGSFLPSADVFPHAGIYSYKVVEVQDTYTTSSDETMAYSQAEYLMMVCVANDPDDGGLYISAVIVKEVLDDQGDNDGDKVDPTPNNGDGNTFAFDNTYTKRGGSTDDASSLVISKNVTGDYADQTKKFSFTFTLTDAATADGTLYTGTIQRADGSTEEVNIEPDVEQTFTLAHGETLTFENLPAGTRYELTETAAEGYTASALVIENGSTPVELNAAAVNTELTTGDRLVGESENSAAYTNENEYTTPTGILINNLPFIVLIGVGAAALTVFIISKKRKISA